MIIPCRRLLTRSIFVAATGLAAVGIACHGGQPTSSSAVTPAGDATLKTYPNINSMAARKVLTNRFGSVKNVSASGSMVLTRPDGQSIQLDMALAMEMPEHLRLRAWKAGQAVFDFTLIPDGLFVETPSDPAARDQILPATVSTGHLAQELLWFSGGYFTQLGLVQQPDVASAVDQSDLMVFSRQLSDGGTVSCAVDRATLTPRQYWQTDNQGNLRFTLDMNGYQVFDGIPWPTHIIAVSAADQPSDNGAPVTGSKIEIQLNQVQINEGLPDKAFVPPAGAERRS